MYPTQSKCRLIRCDARATARQSYDNPVFFTTNSRGPGGRATYQTDVDTGGSHVLSGCPSLKCDKHPFPFSLSRAPARHGLPRVLGRRDRSSAYRTGGSGPPTAGFPTPSDSTTVCVHGVKRLNPLELSKDFPVVAASDGLKMTLPDDSGEVSTNLVANGSAQTGSGDEKSVQPERETWGKKLDFLLSVIGFAVDLGNVWRFPYVCYRNGGGAFLIPYLIMLIFAGLPLFYMELALGQYQRCGMISVWKNICPIFSGVGYGICFIAVFVAMYYNTVVAWAVFYTFSCFRSEVPWARCNNEWNTPDCFSVLQNLNQSAANRTNTSASAAEEFFNRRVLEVQYSNGIDNVGGVKWSMALCLLAVFLVIYFSLWKGIKSSGKAVWITATVPYIVLLVLLVRGCTLPGALNGIIYYVRPEWSRLLHVEVWIDAAAQIFFSLGPGFGTLLALSSYNKFHNNCYMDALVTASINCCTSFMAGFVVFSVLGYMAHIQKKSVENVAIDGPGLVFIVYPEALATLDGSVFWSILFFVMLITLGLDSSFGGLEAVITGVCDEFPKIGKHREIFVAMLISVCFLTGLSSTTYGGQYVISLLDRHGAPISILLICFCESIAVSWFYGARRFSADLKKMLGFEPGIFWKVCWAVICPVFLLVLFVLSCYAYSGISLGSYNFPAWSLALGWIITLTSLICIPIYAIYKLIVTPGTPRQRLRAVITPQVEPSKPHPMSNDTKPPVLYTDLPQSTEV
ncbi:sodium-dependent serotonin transporter-like [Liolophura sinensis]|uniref:sodium-dependent serotonin transporter-like n=1 Tax=Liolophura sinensis TaxID=3198878 RepID=UPI00315984DA